MCLKQYIDAPLSFQTDCPIVGQGVIPNPGYKTGQTIPSGLAYTIDYP